MRSIPCLVAALLAFSLVAAAPSGADEERDVAGAWTLISEVGGRVLEAKLVLERGPGGELSGRYTGHRGRTAELADLAFAEGVLRFTRLAGERAIGFEARVRGDRLEGGQTFAERTVAVVGARGADALAALRAERAKRIQSEADLEADYNQNARRLMPRDGFPVLFDPVLTPAADATTIRDDEPVLGIALGGEAKAYPIEIMGRHEIANDTCGGQPIAASW